MLRLAGRLESLTVSLWPAADSGYGETTRDRFIALATIVEDIAVRLR